MRKILMGIVAATALAAQTASFRIEPSPESRFELKVYKTGLLSGKAHIFVFDRYQGGFDGSKMTFTVEANSIQCLDDWSPASGSKDKILEVAKKDLMDSARHPELKFESESIQGSTATGLLTIRGIAKPVTVTAERKDGFLEGKARIKHSDYKLKQQSAALGAIGTKDEMDVSFRLKVTPQ
jgi:polyisoprenoid-binding protein YceI